MPVENLEFQYEAAEMGQWVRKLAIPDEMERWLRGAGDKKRVTGGEYKIHYVHTRMKSVIMYN